MTVPGVASKAADTIQENAVADEKAERDATEEAHMIEANQGGKSDTENLHEYPVSARLSQDEIQESDAGKFRPYPFPHLEFQDTSSPGTHSAERPSAENGDARGQERRSSTYQRSNSIAKAGANDGGQVRYFGRGSVGRRPSVSQEQISSEAAELARAEAASWAQMTPLLAATFGPLSVLLGIPTLTQRWHGIVLDPPILPGGRSNFIELPDPPLNLILGGVSLFCEVMGNTLLVLRFSNFHTRVTTWVSYIFWMLKILFGIANYVEFGIMHPQTNDIIYLQGFWVDSKP